MQPYTDRAMKFDARKEHSVEQRKAFIEWLTTETISSFQRAERDQERLKAAAFLFANRAREAGVADSEVAEVLGISIARAGLSQTDEEFVADCFDTSDQLVAPVFSRAANSKPLWKLW